MASTRLQFNLDEVNNQDELAIKVQELITLCRGNAATTAVSSSTKDYNTGAADALDIVRLYLNKLHVGVQASSPNTRRVVDANLTTPSVSEPAITTPGSPVPPPTD